MKLVVHGTQPIEQIRAWAENYFSPVPSFPVNGPVSLFPSTQERCLFLTDRRHGAMLFDVNIGNERMIIAGRPI
jgi:secreted Zn-dependent insulinase-like peptidase